jgi:hypothetical protein
MQRVLMFDNGSVEMFSSPGNLCVYIEYPSFNGDEDACMETGESVKLFLDRGANIRGILGEEKFIDDFIFVNFEMTNDFSLKEIFTSRLKKYLTQNGVKYVDGATLPELFDLMQNLVGISF